MNMAIAEINQKNIQVSASNSTSGFAVTDPMLAKEPRKVAGLSFSVRRILPMKAFEAVADNGIANARVNRCARQVQ